MAAYNVNHRENGSHESRKESELRKGKERVEKSIFLNTGRIQIEGAIPGNDIYRGRSDLDGRPSTAKRTKQNNPVLEGKETPKVGTGSKRSVEHRDSQTKQKGTPC